MPIYTYRRADGTTFEIRQKFSEDPLTVDPETGQSVHRVPQASGIVFKGSGFYVTDSKAKNGAATPPSSSNGNGNSNDNGNKDKKADTGSDTTTSAPAADKNQSSKKSPSAAAS